MVGFVVSFVISSRFFSRRRRDYLKKQTAGRRAAALRPQASKNFRHLRFRHHPWQQNTVCIGNDAELELRRVPGQNFADRLHP